MKIQFTHKFEEIISLENLLLAWKEFVCGKRDRKDVQEFSLNLMDNIFLLHDDLLHHTYKHGGYQAFTINDPKRRHIHKASVRDRLVHHAVYRLLYPFFDKTFIADSYSCRLDKGTHKAINRFRQFAYEVSKNNTKTCWVLKCDIRKFFASIDHEVLLNILKEYITDQDIIWLLENIIESFSVTSPQPPLVRGNLKSRFIGEEQCNFLTTLNKVKQKEYVDSEFPLSKGGLRGMLKVGFSHPLCLPLGEGENFKSPPFKGGVGVVLREVTVGLPLGNLTSQLFANIYMNEFDQWVKHWLQIKYYIRYSDDFIFLSRDKNELVDIIFYIRRFLNQELKLKLHPDKIFLKTIASGVDFLGWINFPDYRLLRTKTKRRMFLKIREKHDNFKKGLISEETFNQCLQSYFGMLKHCSGYDMVKKIEDSIN
jgi:retron-type reverse transcriptase